MKLTQFNVKIFVSELEDLESMSSRIRTQAETWLDGQERRDKGYGFDQYGMQAIRMGLEDQLNAFREKLALVYDFQGDRGMADFAPAGFNSNGKEEEEEEEDDRWVDLIFPKEEERAMSMELVKWDPVVANLHMHYALNAR